MAADDLDSAADDLHSVEARFHAREDQIARGGAQGEPGGADVYLCAGAIKVSGARAPADHTLALMGRWLGILIVVALIIVALYYASTYTWA